ncbi:TatD family deoxyribonuclease [Arthrobacter cheniae]|uniref:TatD family deoxyribonuclease n=1 Tax=Arthrobacter cheniae TaxID=1258888 RepID=A0A3A5LZ87_9MICC|nr:TatD family deoxyribonuclease [Arthrobacter cheniae]
MTRSLPPLDLHAHISPKTGATDLERLGAVVFAATRTLDEYKSVKDRNDRVTIWGVGCHPGIPEAQSAYDPSKFTELISSSAYIGEVGLDGRSRVSMADQDRVFRSILTHLQQTPKILSVHSSGATGRTLEALEAIRVKGAVLHWWRGTEAQTKRALDLGCRFSVNAANMQHATDLLMIPMNRILIETDHPSGNRSSSSPRQPGSILDVEAGLAKLHGTTTETIRRETWLNFAHLVDEVAVGTLLPHPVQRMLSVARN